MSENTHIGNRIQKYRKIKELSQEELAEKTGLSVMGIIPDTQLEKNNSGAYTYGYGHNHKL